MQVLCELPAKPHLKWASDYKLHADVVLEPVEYRCDDVAAIRYCRGVDGSEVRRGYWYLRMPIVDDTLTSEYTYWGGVAWRHNTPKQFESPEAAYGEWLLIKGGAV